MLLLYVIIHKRVAYLPLLIFCANISLKTMSDSKEQAKHDVNSDEINESSDRDESEVEDEIELGSHDTDTDEDEDNSDCDSAYSQDSFVTKSDDDEENDSGVEFVDASVHEPSSGDAQRLPPPNTEAPSASSTQPAVAGKVDRLQAMIHRYERMLGTEETDTKAPKRRRK